MASEAANLRFPYPQEDPETLRDQRRALTNLGQLMLDTHAEVNDDSLKLTESWRSDTATTAVADVKVLSSAMKGDSDRLADAAAAITTYIGAVDDARGDIDGIRTQYDDAVGDRTEANINMPDGVDSRWEREEQRAANQSTFETTASGLDDDYETVLSTLKTKSKPSVTELVDVLSRFVGDNPPASQSLGEVAFEKASENLDLTGGRYEFRLRQEGLLTGASPDGFYAQWLENAERQGVDPETLVSIAREHGITPEDFEVLEGLEEITDPDGKSFFLLPEDISGDDAQKAVLMTYILNAGTDYGDAGQEPGVTNDFPETPYSAEEVQRIIDRQEDNDWSYDDDVGFVHGNDGRLVATPNGMLMGAGGNWVQDLYSQQGGTAWGDIFMLNIDDVDDPAEALREVVRSGKSTYEDDDGNLYQGDLDLDRLLHHEERHSQQWAREGYAGFLASYAWEQLTRGNETEEDAGLSDGGYG